MKRATSAPDEAQWGSHSVEVTVATAAEAVVVALGMVERALRANGVPVAFTEVGYHDFCGGMHFDILLDGVEIRG